MTQITQITQSEGGNTSTPSLDIRARRWCLTINNYNENNITQIHKYFDYYIIGKEIGNEGTPHLQIYVEKKNAVSFNKIKKLFPTAHIEKAKGNRKQNLEYCKKQGDYITNLEELSFKEKLKIQILKSYENTKWKPWQQKIIDILDDKPDDRKIYWFWEPIGNIGKSYLAKYIACKYDVIICDGKKNDIFNQVNMTLEKEKIPNIILLDIPRSSNGFVNYGSIEQLKDGMIYSGKYEGGLCIFPKPHVICFSNQLPNTTEMSQDRWDINNISKI